MKDQDKKELSGQLVVKPDHVLPEKKQSSGDKKFDAAIDKLLRPMPRVIAK